MSKRKVSKIVIDTNVPKTANLAIDPASIPDDLVLCVQACVDSMEHVIQNRGVVLDANGEIFDEYRKQLSMSGQPGIGDMFLKWLHYNQYTFPEMDRVPITKNGDTYDEFPDHIDLAEFDISDRKFIAVANAHMDKPPILQATDSKWWGWKEGLQESGISVTFLCPDYMKAKFHKKIEK